MTVHNITPAECFHQATSPTTTATTTIQKIPSGNTRRYFTVDENIATPLWTFGTKNDLPDWLSASKAHLIHQNLDQLRNAMLHSFFTENEILKLTYAIQEAAGGDENKIAGAAEFCSIMVETMEMGLNALVAGAFHYCSCVRARELDSTCSSSEQDSWEICLGPEPKNMETFGMHALHIERDASRLKRLEMVASMVETPNSQGADNLRNLFLTESKDWRALAIRGAACLYRLKGILKTLYTQQTNQYHLSKENNRVCREALKIYAPLASRLGMHRLKNELEETAFKILYRRQYDTVTSLLHENKNDQSIGENMQEILTQVQAEMTEILQNDPEFASATQDFTVTARVKEAYSTWKKMLRNNLHDILQVPDAIALRIVINAKQTFEDEPDYVTRAKERALCYYAQELCRQRWAPSHENARFKDYIATPKPNGYQSLHYTATTEWLGEQWSMEIQVRSGEMNNVAEFGVASHWDYKSRGKQPISETNSDEQKEENHNDDYYNSMLVIQQTSDAYLRSLQEYHWQQHGTRSFDTDAEPSTMEPCSIMTEEGILRAERIQERTQRLAPYIEALTTAQSDLARENVFVFLSQSEESTSEGAVLALPAGAVVLDAIRQSEELKFIPEELISHNGSPASLTSRLCNGDILSFPSVMTTSVI